ncbi:hypothetical protein [Microbulbifer sp.]|uniref:hypothetical protein n=1 Tax=Microbulbifer sp. TaxID=1908541 RepID=UPI003F332780
MPTIGSFRRAPLLSLALGLSLVVARPADAQEHDLHFESRLRGAYVDAGSTDGRATSLLLRFTLESEWNGVFSTLAEIDHVSTGWRDDHSDGARFNDMPLIPDVPGTEVNQAALGLTFSQAEVLLGRQRITLDNQRFVGSNGFWQNDQTFDALSASYELFSGSRLYYAYIANANRIFGDDADGQPRNDGYYSAGSDPGESGFLGDHEHNSHLINAHFNEWDFSDLGIYYYHIDNRDAEPDSNRSLGLRYSFERRIAGLKWRSEIEGALQKRMQIEDAPTNTYSRIEFALALHSLEVGLQQERLGASGGVGFVTPLASAHDFQGWADKAFAIDSKGMVDRAVKASWRKSPLKIDARYHFFESVSGDVDWGREFDLDLIVKLARRHRIQLRYANYQSASQSRAALPDEQRLYLDYSFEY